MLLVIGTFRLPPEAMTQARVVEASRAEPGCRAYAYAEDLLEPGLIRVSEAWDDREALTTHFEQAHMKQWQSERTALGMTGRHMAAYEIGSEETL